MSNNSGRTPLMDACRRGDFEEVQRMIAEGADVNATNVNGTTPLMYAKTAAFGNGDWRIIHLLLKSGARLDARDVHGKTALDYTLERAAHLKSLLSE